MSAPAGFGKTTLVSAWAAESAAWVSLEESDQDPITFWTYVLTALDRLAPGIAEGALAVLQSGPAPIETILAGVLNELSVLPDEIDLGNAASPHELVLRLQWRSTNGNPVHMLRGDLTEAYAGEPGRHFPEHPRLVRRVEVREDQIDGFQSFTPRVAAPEPEKPKPVPVFGGRNRRYSNRL